VHRQTQNLTARRIHRVQPARVAARHDILTHFVAALLRLMGGPDNGYAARLEQEAETILGEA
jgi:hypothetical protein